MTYAQTSTKKARAFTRAAIAQLEMILNKRSLEIIGGSVCGENDVRTIDIGGPMLVQHRTGKSTLTITIDYRKKPR